MTCAHCCDANKFFDIKNASKELKKYRKKGAWGTTKKLIAALEEINVTDKTLLDIGGGIGALQWYFLENGGRSTISVDASSGYLEVSGKYADEKSWNEKAQFIEGDFNDVAETIDKSDVVTLDKVICCYPDYNRILQNAIDKTNEYLAVSYPVSNWISRALNWMGRAFFVFKKSHFRTYIHPSRKIRNIIESRGLELSGHTMKFPWHIEIYSLKTA